jgi:hypothetical protein
VQSEAKYAHEPLRSLTILTSFETDDVADFACASDEAAAVPPTNAAAAAAAPAIGAGCGAMAAGAAEADDMTH